MKRILFLCTGNYYRSRFAEIFFNWHAERRGIPWRAGSRGLSLVQSNVGPLSRHTVARLSIHGIPVDDHQRLPLAAGFQDFEAAHVIIAVKEIEHRPLIAEKFPTFLQRVRFWDVHDVDCAAATDAMPILEDHVLRLLDRLAGEANQVHAGYPPTGEPSCPRVT